MNKCVIIIEWAHRLVLPSLPRDTSQVGQVLPSRGLISFHLWFFSIIYDRVQASPKFAGGDYQLLSSSPKIISF